MFSGVAKTRLTDQAGERPGKKSSYLPGSGIFESTLAGGRGSGILESTLAGRHGSGIFASTLAEEARIRNV